MALKSDGKEQEDSVDDKAQRDTSNGRASIDSEEEEDDEEDEEDEEPRLEYASLTRSLGPVYRNGDATSAFLVGGDKMVIGTHNGNIHAISLPTLQSLRVYHAHSASITTVSISPFPPPLLTAKSDAVKRIASEIRSSPAPSTPSGKGGNTGSPAGRSPRPAPTPATPSNSIYIATASLDGNICVASLFDPKDVMLRNFGRPLRAVALSPEYRIDRSYLSGGLAGNLILTTGGQPGTSSTSTTVGGAVASASGWLSTIGLGSNTGKDTVLHSGEGTISNIKWSLSGKYVVWVNEQGIKIMRSNLHLEVAETEFAWKRISHVDRPNRPEWEEMAGVWKAQLEWIDDADFENTDNGWATSNGSHTYTNDSTKSDSQAREIPARRKPAEKLLVGWGGTVWILKVHHGGPGTGKDVGEPKMGRVEIITILRTDCIISGISLYTPNLLLVLAYVLPEQNGNQGTTSAQSTPKRGGKRIHNALQPEMRIIDINTKEEVCMADTLNVSRFESLSATDYHLGVLPPPRLNNITATQRGMLETISGGIWEASMYPVRIGGGIWDASMYPVRFFSTAASVRSGGSHSEPGSSSKARSNVMSSDTEQRQPPTHPAALVQGMKIFIHSPYDCVLATKPTISDHLLWLENHGKYEEAWTLLNEHPEAVGGLLATESDSTPSTPTRDKGSLVDFFADDSSQATSNGKTFYSTVEKEKRRIGEKWVQQLVSADEWKKAGQICERVLGTSSSWEHWVWVFAHAGKYDEITPHIPTAQLRPPLPSTVYEVVLGHYTSRNRPRLKELLNRWSPDLFDIGSVIAHIQGNLDAGDVREDTVEDGEQGRDWRILMESLAKLHLADGRPREALKCYIRLQDADTVMSLISQFHLVDAVSDDIPGFILLRVSKEQQRDAPLSELEEATSEPIRLLVDEAFQGIVRPETVISQLESHDALRAYLFFYFRALWNGSTSSTSKMEPTTLTNLAATEGQSLVSLHADTALHLFASYDRPLLFTFLKTSQSYTLSLASRLCAELHYIPEHVYLLAKEGHTAQALTLIIEQLGDVSQAIAFAKEQDDPELWDDLLEYSMNKPRFIRALLSEVGTAIDPIKLVQRIPEGLEIEGLRDGLSHMIKEYEIQASISEGVARVLRGEVATAMVTRGMGQKRGIKFNIDTKVHTRPSEGGVKNARKAGHCAHCGRLFSEDDPSPLLGFPCTHIFHLPCLLTSLSQTTTSSSPPSSPPLPPLNPLGDFSESTFERSIGPKVDHARLVRGMVGRGCPLERLER